MRPSRRTFALLLLLPALALSGCATVQVSSERYIGVPQAVPTNPASVEILRKEPTRPHFQVGEVFLSPSPDTSVDSIEKALRAESARLGADAAVVVRDRTKRVGTYISGSWWVRYHAPVYSRQIVAVAIRYDGH